jgi:glycerol-3-phosphate dehydrogenase (NAD(P)+)
LIMEENNNIVIGIIGAGGWGTAIAQLLTENGYKVLLWAYEPEVVVEINTLHINSIFLPGIKLSDKIIATNNIEDLSESSLYILALPTQYIRSVLLQNKLDFSGKVVVNVAKGIERESLKRISEILCESFSVEPDNYVVLTGPSHAEEVARKIPTTVVGASSSFYSANEVQKIFSNSYFRVYTSDDVAGCELGGAIKNIIAIAAGIIDGLGLGDNTKAALITRGLAERSRLGVALGANAQTFAGLSGLGDLIVTCNSRHSRNRYVGEQLGRGLSYQKITSEMKMIAEGVLTTKSSFLLARRHGVELPIVEQVYKILFEGTKPIDAINDLMTRQSKREWWW